MLLKRNFYNRNTIKVSKELLGCFLVRKYRGKIMKATIVETEAYRGEHDLASHASKGRTARTEIMYGEAGRAYVYMIYGMYFMLNVVTEEKDFPAAILIRAVKTEDGKKFLGPGKLTKFLHIDKSLNDWNLTKGEKLWLESTDSSRDEAGWRTKVKKRLKIISSPRVGVDYARHSKNWKWNFRISSKKG